MAISQTILTLVAPCPSGANHPQRPHRSGRPREMLSLVAPVADGIASCAKFLAFSSGYPGILNSGAITALPFTVMPMRICLTG
jgi:hypothetical protein